MPRILCIGDAMLDVLVLIDSDIHYGSDTPSRITTHGGGAAANTATWMAHQGNQVFFVSRVGDDAAGRAVISELDAWNIEHKQIQQSVGKTGVVVVIVDKTGQRTMFPDSGANSGLTSADLPSLSGFDAAFLSGYSLFNPESTDGVEGMISAIKSAGIPLIFDPASVGTISHFGLEKALTYLNQMDVILPNEEEALFLTQTSTVDEALSQLNKFTKTVVIKRGDKGAYGAAESQQPVAAPTSPVTPIDTTGAGDAFAAAFIPRWITTRDLQESMAAGNALARECVTIIGARPSVNPQ